MANKVNLSWPANPAEEQVTKYEVFQSKDGAPFVSLGPVAGNFREILGLNAGIYTFKVKAINLAGSGPESDPSSTPPLPSKPGPVTIVVTET